MQLFAMSPFQMGSSFMQQFSEDIARQIISFQKAAFENSLAAADILREQAANMVASFWGQTPWLPEGGKHLMNYLTGSLQEGGRRFGRSVQEGFERMGESLRRGDEEKTPDVLLDVPALDLDEIKLKVDTLQARISLKAGLAGLVDISVGADVDVGKVDLGLKGVEARALLKVRLKEVNAILTRALETLDSNPELIGSLVNPAGGIAGKAAKGAGSALEKIGETAGDALAPQGSLQEVVRGVAAREGPVWEALKEVSQRIDQAVQGEKSAREKQRRHTHEKEHHE